MARRTTDGHTALESGPTNENLLNETDGSFRDFAECSDDLFWETDAAGAFTRLDNELAKQLGLTTQALLGQIGASLIVQYIDDTAAQYHRACREKRLPYKNVILKAKNSVAQRDVWMRISGVPRLSANGELMGYRGTATDISLDVERDIELRTTNARLEQTILELRAAKRRMDAVIKSSIDCIVCMDVDGLVTEFNPAAERTFGYSRQEVIGRELSALMIPPRDRQAHNKGLAHYRRTGEGRVIDQRLVVNAMRSSGETFPCEVAVSRIESVDEPLQFMATLRDITDRREAEMKVIQASKLATLGEIAASRAHELNQPLNVISMACGNIQFRLERGDTEPSYIDGKVQRIADQVIRASSIVDHMRVFARQEATTAPKPFRVETALEGAADLMRAQLRVRNISLDLSFEDNLPAVRGNAVHLEQVLMNLIVNARDAMQTLENSAKRIDILALNKDDERISIRVQDNGPGIPTDVAERIFEPFYTTKPSGVGTGLGLSISSRLIKEMGGTISYQKREDAAGACFEILLHAVPADDVTGQ